MIVLSDTDYTVYLVNKCTCLKDVRYNSTTNIITEFVVYTAAEIKTYRWSLILDWYKAVNKPLLS